MDKALPKPPTAPPEPKPAPLVSHPPVPKHVGETITHDNHGGAYRHSQRGPR